MTNPTTGATMRAYCDCANKKRDESAPVIAAPVETTWVCRTEFRDNIKTGLFSSAGRFRYFWQCLNCSKRQLIGTWDSNGLGYGE